MSSSSPLSPINRDHQLTGNLKDYRECHLGGDWLLIYWSKQDNAFLIEIPGCMADAQ